MIGIKRNLIMLAAGAAFAVSGSLGASAAPAGNPAIAGAVSDNGITLVGNHGKNGQPWKPNGNGGNYGGNNPGGSGGNYSGNKPPKHGGNHGGKHYRGYGYNNFFFGSPFYYNDYGYYDGYDYSSYRYRYNYNNSCYRECRTEHGPRYCRNNWEDYC
jgi:hypothetical protein